MKDLEVLRNLAYSCTDALIKGVSIETVINWVNHADIEEVHRKGLLRVLNAKEDNYLKVALETLTNVLSYCNDRGTKRVALFEKVSKGIFVESAIENELFEGDLEVIESAYDVVTLPKRSTTGSAGYDFVTPIDITLKPGESVLIPSGIRCCMLESWVLMAYPRSGLGTKYRVQMDNTTPVIDSDYYYSDNEGHIMFKITNDGKEGKVLELKAGERFCQGVFLEYGVTVDDLAINKRNGGFGSSGN